MYSIINSFLLHVGIKNRDSLTTRHMVISKEISETSVKITLQTSCETVSEKTDIEIRELY